MILIERVLVATETRATPDSDYLHIEWYEASKRILRRQTEQGRELGIRLHKQSLPLSHGAALWQDRQVTVFVNIIPCESIVLSPRSMEEMGALCYEIGNRHLPLFMQDQCLLMPYENPAFWFLEKLGYQPQKATHRLTNLLRTTVQLSLNPAQSTQPLIDASTEIILS